MRLTFIFIILIIPGFLFAQEDTQVFDLDQCLEYALENNPEVQTSKLDREIAKEKVDQTISTGLPQITGNVDMTYNYEVATQFFPDFISPSVYGVLFEEGVLEPRNLGEPQIFPAQFGVPYTGSAVLSLRQMIFNGSYFVGLKAARTFTDLSRKELLKKETDIVEGVSKAYYGALISREQIELIEANYARLDSLLRDTEALLDAGFAEKIDLNRIKIQFNNISVEKKYARELYDLNIHILKVQMGMPLSQNLELADNLEEIRFQAIEELPENFSVNNRIEYDILQTNEELVNLDIKNVQAQYIPQINLFGNYGYNTGRQEFSQLFNQEWFSLGAVGVTMDIPIFDGFLKKSQIEEKRIQKDQIRIAREALENTINLQIEQAELQYEKSLENMALQYENMELAEEVYNVAKIKYEEGVGSNIEITNADTDLKTAQNNYYSALYDALVAKVDLEKAYGKLYDNIEN